MWELAIRPRERRIAVWEEAQSARFEKGGQAQSARLGLGHAQSARCEDAGDDDEDGVQKHHRSASCSKTQFLYWLWCI